MVGPDSDGTLSNPKAPLYERLKSAQPSSNSPATDHHPASHRSAQDSRNGRPEDGEKGSDPGSKGSTRNPVREGPHCHGEKAGAQHSSTTNATIRDGGTQRLAQESHHGGSGRERGGDTRSKTSSSREGQGEQGGKLRKLPPNPTEETLRHNKRLREKASSDSTSSAGLDNSPDGSPRSSTDKAGGPDHISGASKATAAAKAQLEHKNASHTQPPTKENPSRAATRSNSSDTQPSASPNSRQPQATAGPAVLPPGAAEARPPTGSRPTERQPEGGPPDGHLTQQHLPGLDDHATDPTDDEEVDSDVTPCPQPPGGLPTATDEGQKVPGEGSAANTAPASGYFSGFGRTIAGVLGPGAGPVPSPRDRLKEELYRTRGSLKNLEHEYRRLKGEAYHLNRSCVDLDHENRRQKDTIQSLQHELNHMGRELQEYKTLSDVRGRELIGSQVFLTKADMVSVSDVKDMVNALNDEIFQASASLGDSLVHRKYPLSQEEVDAVHADVCRTVSELLARVLLSETKKPESEINPLVVQVVLQIILVRFCSSKIESWFPGAVETSDFLTSIYSQIRRSEEQAVSGRWRSLTRAQIHPTSGPWQAEFFGDLDSVLKYAEWGIRSQEDYTAFEQKLATIFKAVEDLRLALGEKVTSIDIEVNVVPPKIPFNYQWMEDEHGDSRQGNKKKSQDVVAGTTGIGLKKVLPSPSVEESFENILSPKVVLVSTLKEALLPPPPRPNKKDKKVPGLGEGQEGPGRTSPTKRPMNNDDTSRGNESKEH